MKTKYLINRVCITLIVCATMSVGNVAAQATSVDSLIREAELFLYSSPDKAYEIALQAIKVSKDKKDNILLGNSYNFLGAYYSTLGNLEQATIAYNTADSLFRMSKGKLSILGLGLVTQGFGAIEQRKGNYLKALEYYNETIILLDSVNNKTVLPFVLNNLSSIYAYMQDYPRSEKYARECLVVSKEINNKHLISVSCVTLASALMFQKNFDEVPTLVKDAELIALERKDLYILCLCYVNDAMYYFHKSDFSKAIKEYQKAIVYADSLNNEFEQMRIFCNLSELYVLNHQFAEAEATGLKGLSISQKIGSLDHEYFVLNVMAKIKAFQKDYVKAYTYLNKSYILKDSVLNEEKQRQINYMEYTFQTEKKNLQISSLEKEKQLMQQEQRLYIWLGIAGGALLLSLALVFIYRHRLSCRKMKQLEQEKQLVATQAVLDGETAERTRLARDLHDGLGGMLSVVKHNLPHIKEGVTLESVDVDRFTYALNTLNESINELRRVAHNMMPDSLTRFGLKASLTDFCNSIPGAEFHYFGSGDRLDSKLEVMIYRTVHELLNNVLKHAGATKIIVQIVQETDRIAITVQDDGCGFDTAVETKGMGLNNIRNRVGSYNGHMEVWSKPGEGTEISVNFKLQE